MKRAVILLAMTASICVFAEDLPSSFDWRDVDGKCHVTPVRTIGSKETAWATVIADALEATYLATTKTNYRVLNEEGTGFDEEKMKEFLVDVDEILEQCKDVPGLASSSYGGDSVAQEEGFDITKAYGYLMRKGYKGIKVLCMSMDEGVLDSYDSEEEDWEESLLSCKYMIMDAPAISHYYLPDTKDLEGRWDWEQYCADSSHYYMDSYHTTSDIHWEHYRPALVIGWDDSIPASSFKTWLGDEPPGDGAWIVKGFRGDVGLEGTFYVSYYDYNVMRYAYASSFLTYPQYYPEQIHQLTFDLAGNTKELYSNSDFTPCGIDSGHGRENKCATMFEAREDGFINALGAFISGQGSTTVEIYTNCVAGVPDSGGCAGKANIYNYWNVNRYAMRTLGEMIPIKKGERFSLLTKDLAGLVWSVSSSPRQGRSFYYTGSEWQDTVSPDGDGGLEANYYPVMWRKTIDGRTCLCDTPCLTAYTASELQVKPIGCDYSAEGGGDLNIAWTQLQFTDAELAEMSEYEIAQVSEVNWRLLSNLSFSIWRSSEAPDVAYDDFSLASNIVQHVQGTNFVDKSFGRFIGTKPVKYWVEIEGSAKAGVGPDFSGMRTRPENEPGCSCVTRRRFGLAIGVGTFDPNGKTAKQPVIPEPAKDTALFKSLFENEYKGFHAGFHTVNDESATVEGVGNAFKQIRYKEDGTPNALPGDILILYMAMHGENQRLVLYDDFYSIEQLYTDLAVLDVNSGVKVIGMMMACHSQSLSDPAEMRDDTMTLADRFDNIAWITSCRYNQKSSSIGDGLSLFGRCLLQFGWEQQYGDIGKIENLSSSKALPWGKMNERCSRDGVITFWELGSYAYVFAVGRSSRLRSSVCATNPRLLEGTIAACNAKPMLKDVPVAPQKVEVRNFNGSITVRWENSSDAEFYCVYYRRVGDDTWDYWLETPNDGHWSYATFENSRDALSDWARFANFVHSWNDRFVDDWLWDIYEPDLLYAAPEYGAEYEFQVVGVNQVGIGRHSASIKEKVLDCEDTIKEAGNMKFSGSSADTFGNPVHLETNIVFINELGEDGKTEVEIVTTYSANGTTSTYKGTAIVHSNEVCVATLSGEADSIDVEITTLGMIARIGNNVVGCLREDNITSSVEREIAFSDLSLTIDEGDTARVRVLGGNAESDTSVKLYLTYNTAAAADLDLAKGTIDGVTPKGGLKFPLTLSWEAGEVGEKVIAIPIKKDTAVEYDEFFTLQLADAQGMELGEDRTCRITIHDPGSDEMSKPRSPYVCVLADPANAGKVTGNGLYVAGKKVTLKATANKGYAFAGWYAAGNREEGIGNSSADGLLSQAASYMIDTMPSNDVEYVARFVTTAEDEASLAIAVEDMETEADGTIGTIGTDGARAFDLGACVTSLSLPKLAVSGLPSGLKFDTKTNKITGKATKPGVYMVTVKATNASVTKATKATTATFKLTVRNFTCAALPGLFAATDAYGTVRVGVEFGADRIDCTLEKDWSVKVAGLPAGLKYDAKANKITGVPTAKPGAYTVTFTASKKGEKKQIATITLNVEALPDWTVGTFTGYVHSGDYGLATMTVAANGKISGKVSLGGTNWTFKADSYANVESLPSAAGEGVETNYVIKAVAAAGKEKRTLELRVANMQTAGSSGDDGQGATIPPEMINAKVTGNSEVGGETFSLWRTIWKDKATAGAAKATLAEWEGTYNVSFEPSENSGYGSGYLSLAVGKDGNVKTTGKLADGTAISATSPLLYDGEYGYFTLVYAAPSAYKGGSFALSISFDEAKGVLGNRVEVSRWSSRNPQSTGQYGTGFARYVSFFGAYYDKNASLTNLYDRLTFTLAELPPLASSCKWTYRDENDRKVTETRQGEAAPVYLLGQDGLTVSVNAKGTGFDVLKATKPEQDKTTKRWKYWGTNDGGLTLSFNQKTGVFKGAYTFWYDYLSGYDETTGKESWAHSSKKVTFEGLMVQGEILRGFYLREESVSYEDPKTGKQNAYKYKSSHVIRFLSPDSDWRYINREGEWRYSVPVRWGEEHTFWIDGFSADTSVLGINVERTFTYEVDGEEREDYVGASERGEIFDKDGNVVGLFVILTADDWPEIDNIPKSLSLRVIVDGDYGDGNVDRRKFKFHHLCGKGVFP